MKRFFWLLASMIFIVLTSFESNAQDSTSEMKIRYVVITKEGNQFVGDLVGNLESQIVIDTENFGRLFFQRSELKDHFPFDERKLRESGSAAEEITAAVYFFDQSVFPLEAGEILYQNNWLIFNQFHFGVTDRLTASTGLVIGGGLGLWVNAKYHIPIKENLNLSAGTMLFSLFGESGTVGLVYGKSSFGSKSNHISTGLAFGYAGDEFGRTPIILLEGISSLGRSWSIMVESYLIPVDGIQGIWQFGFRKNFQRWTIEAGLLGINLDSDFVPVVPVLGVKIPVKSK